MEDDCADAPNRVAADADAEVNVTSAASAFAYKRAEVYSVMQAPVLLAEAWFR